MGVLTRLGRHLLLISTMLMLVGGIVAAPANAAYLRDIPQTLTQPDGQILECLASGDEFYNWLHDANGFVIMRNPADGYYVYAALQNGDLVPTDYIAGSVDPASVGLVPNIHPSPERLSARRSHSVLLAASIEGPAPAPRVGTINNLVVFIRFSQESEFTDLLSLYDGQFNSSTSGVNSMRNYYQEASYGQLTITTSFYPIAGGTTVVSYQDSHLRGYFQPYDATSNPIGYQGGDDGSERTSREHILLKNAIAAIQAQVPTNLNLDGDGDGNVDNVCFIVKGSPTGWASLLWPHMWSLYSQTASINGKRVYTYNLQLQSSVKVGVLCHEMFHSLGSPDLYHYSYDGLNPVGTWDIMEYDQNPPQHMSAYMKYEYGKWIPSIPEITTSGTYVLNPLTSNTNNCYKIRSPYSTSEYFVLEYRQKTGTFERSIPGSGLLVYRIRPALNGNANGPPDEVYIYRPGGTTTTNGTYSSAYFCSTSGRTSINDTTNPSSFLSDGGPGGLRISNVSAAGQTISFYVDTSLLDSVLAPTITPAGGTFTGPIQVTMKTLTAGATVHYTTNGIDPTENDPIASSAISVNMPITLKAKAWKQGGNSSGVSAASFSFKAPKPTFSVAPGTYHTSQLVSINCTDSSAVVRYTTDGSDPTETSPLANGPITVDKPMTLKARAWRSGWDGSDIASSTYVVRGPILYVNQGPLRPDSPWTNVYSSINQAIAASIPEDEIWVAAGTYSEHIQIPNGVALFGGFNTSETARDQRNWSGNTTIIDGKGATGSVVSVLGTNLALTRLDGFLVRNGNSSGDGGGILCQHAQVTLANNTLTANSASQGAGIACEMQTTAKINGNTIAGNMATGKGGGIYVDASSTPVIFANRITANSASDGGGMYALPPVVLTANSITSNSASNICGGLYLSGPCQVIGNSVVGNTAPYYGGILLSGSASTVTNNISAFNSAGICVVSGAEGSTFRNNCVYGNTGGDYVGTTAASGDVRVDPRLVDRANGDCHLLPDSPCIDAGDDQSVQPGWTDLDDDLRISGAHVDIGADEFTGNVRLPMPVFDPPAGIYSAPQNVNIRCAIGGAAIRYTTDGSDPTQSSPLAEGPVLVDRSLTLRARAWKDGWSFSPIASAAYSLVPFSTTGGFIKTGRWNLISVPANPVNTDPLGVFSGIDLANASFQFWDNNRDGGGYVTYGDMDNWYGPIQRGIPYWFMEPKTGPDKDIHFYGNLPSEDFVLTIAAHSGAPFWIMLGTPYPDAVPADNLRFRNVSKRGDSWLTWAEAFSQDSPDLRIVDSNLQTWEASWSRFVTVTPSSWTGYHTLDPWMGFWLLVYDKGELQIKIPKP